MNKLLKTIVQDYGWIHTAIGAVGNFTFFIGSIFFLPSFSKLLVVGVWLFILGSLLMMVGAIGDFFVKVYETQERKAARQAHA